MLTGLFTNFKMDENQQNFYKSMVDRLNNPNNTTMRNVPIEVYRVGMDFDAWVCMFVDTIKAVNNLTDSQADVTRLNALSLSWLPTKLEHGSARSAYDNLPQDQKDTWPTLKNALSKAFRDTSDEIAFLNSESHWRRTPGMSLRDYRNGLVVRLDKYMSGLRGVDQEWNRAAVRRFRAGLDNPIIAAHILMQCTGDKHTLEEAFSIAVNFENTLTTLNNSATVAPTLAGMLPVAQMAALADPPQMNVLQSQSQPQDRRFEAIETSVRKSELDMSELKSAITEVKEGMKDIKTEFDNLRQAPQPQYQRQARPYFPMSRMPLANSPPRPYFYGRQMGARPGITPGLTRGPGFANAPQRPYVNAYQQTYPAPDPFGSRMGRQMTDVKFPTQGASAPSMGAMESKGQGQGQGKDSVSQESFTFPNPNLRSGNHDVGYGWVDCELSGAVDDGYDIMPEGAYGFCDNQPAF